MSTDIVVGIDGSENSLAALRWAVAEAELRDVRVRAVLSWSYLGTDNTDLGIGTTSDDAAKALDAAIEAGIGDDRARVDAVCVNDLPVSGLLDQSATASMIVMGHRGRGKVRGVLLGSVARTVVERSKVPVVVVPVGA